MNVIVTGASKGIGKAIAAAFAAEGATVFICSRNEVNLYNTVAELQLKYPNSTIKAKAVDLASKEQTLDFGQWILSEIERLHPGQSPDILVNNAGEFFPGSVYNEADGLLEKTIASNLYSAYHLTRTLVPSMIAAKKGHIFNMCSTASLQAYANGGSYSISKFALLGFSKNLREELKPHLVKVTAVSPGAVLTDSWGSYDNTTKRIMEAEDIATMVLACSKLSPQAVVEDILIRPQLGDL